MSPLLKQVKIPTQSGHGDAFTNQLSGSASVSYWVIVSVYGGHYFSTMYSGQKKGLVLRTGLFAVLEDVARECFTFK